MTRKIIVSAVLGAGLLVAAHGGAQAAIACDGNFQIVNGYPVATLYCREWNLARVARKFGWRVSVDDIRYSETRKAQLCRAIGFDLEVQDICGPYSNGSGGNRYTN
jgi:hypothetical protein